MSHPLFSWALAATLALPAPALAQPALLRDLRTGALSLPAPNATADASTHSAVSSGGSIYFQASSPMTGRELWRTDGTPEGTRMVADLWPGPQGSVPEGLTDLDGTLVFWTRGIIGNELWKTDGTPQGTVRLLALGPPGLDAPPFQPLTRAGARLFFTGPDAEPWKTDGTPQGTVRLKDIAPGEQLVSSPRWMAGVGQTLFLLTTLNELWKSDGTEAGTVLVRAFGSTSSAVWSPQPLGSALLFLVSEQGATRLWRSDGTLAGTQVVADLPEGGAPSVRWKATVAGDRLFLASDKALWVSDGTASGTRALTSLSSQPLMADLGGSLVFSQETALWRSDGPDGNVVRIKALPVHHYIRALLRRGQELYFIADDAASSGNALWKTDGTEAGTVRVKAFDRREDGASPYLSSPRSAGDWLFFDLYFPNDVTTQPWVSDGTEAGTRPLTSTQQEPLSSRPHTWLPLAGQALFLADEGRPGASLWRTDGTAAGTTPVRDLPLPSSRSPLAAVPQGGNAFFYSGDTLWKSNGTEAGTVAVRRFTGTWFMPELVRMGETLFFTAMENTASGAELWKSDGTEAGTVLVKDISPAAWGSEPRFLREVGGQLYFSASHSTYGRELWKSDGTEAGTVLVKDIAPGPGGVDPWALAGVGKTLSFRTSGGQPWMSDGTEAGTRQVPFRQGLYGGMAHVLEGEALYFQLVDLAGGSAGLWRLEEGGAPVEVWRSPAGQPAPSVRGGFARAKGGVVFMAWDAAHGLELWRTDGTQEGTALLKDIGPGPDNGIRQPQAPEVFVLKDQGLVLFAASDGESGEELWMTDGTAEGTVRVADVRPGPGSAVPRGLARLGDTLLFSAVDETAGLEPHVLPVPVWTDRSPPTLTCPGEVRATASDASGAAVSYPPATATDLSGEPEVKYSQASGSVFPVGTTQVTVTATDAVGLSRQCTFAVSVTHEPASPFGCACGAGGAGPVALWSLLALLAGAVRRRSV